MQPVEGPVDELHADAVRAIQCVAGGKMLGHACKAQVQPRYQVLVIMLGDVCPQAPGEASRVSFDVVDEVEHLFRRVANQRMAMDLHEYSLARSASRARERSPLYRAWPGKKTTMPRADRRSP